MSRFLQSLGFLGSLIAAACCLGLPFVIAGVTALGAGFLIQDRYLLPLLAVFLVISIAGTALSVRRHHRKTPVIFSIVGAVVTFGGLFLNPAVAYVGIAVLLLASILDYRAKKAASCEVPRSSRQSAPACD